VVRDSTGGIAEVDGPSTSSPPEETVLVPVVPDRPIFDDHDRGTGRAQRWLPTLAELLAGELREQILGGEIPDGGKLPKQQDLLDEFHVSAPSLREALRILENEGLVTVKRGKVGGATIHRPTAMSVANIVALVLEARSATIADVAELLETIEPLCVALCVGRDSLQSTILPVLGDAIEGESGTSAERFHDLLVESCGNETMLLLYQALMAVWSSHMVPHDEDGAPRGQDVGERAASAHRRLLTLMSQGDAIVARQFASRHLIETERFEPTQRGLKADAGLPGDVSVGLLRTTSPAMSADPGGIKQTSRVAEVIAAELRRRILLGEVADGGQLDKQRELAESFNVSFPAVREALRILESEGLLMVRRGSIGGSVVRTPRAGNVAYALALVLQSRGASLQDLVVALQQLEPLCAAACARRGDRLVAVTPLLDPIIEKAHQVIDDPEAFAAEAMSFHDVLIAQCGNTAQTLIVGAMQSLWSAQMRGLKRISQGLGVINDRSKRLEVLSEHEHLCTLIAAGDADAAESLARSHFGHADRQQSFTGQGLRVHASMLRE
jgi:DNA-binding FadR family transcriptional regulator